MKLQRVDYLQVGALKSDASVQIFPAQSNKFQQRFVVGDQHGLLQVVAVKKGQPYADFQVDLGGPINCVNIFNHSGTMEIIIAASSQTLYAFNRKGRTIFTLETNLVEPIQHLTVTDNKDILVANFYVYNHYRDNKETNYYLSTDRINSLTVLPTKKVPSLTPLLACQDSTVYSLRDSSVRHQLLLDGIPTVLHLYQNDGGTSGEWIIFGTSCGKIGLICCSRAGPLVQWTLPPTAQSDASITSVDFYDLSGTGSQLLVGRADGTVQVFEFNSDGQENQNYRTPPTCVFTKNYNDSIAVVRGGVIGSNGYPEILVATHQGWIFGLTTNLSTAGQTRDEVIGASEALIESANHRRNQLQALKSQVAQLEAEVTELQGKMSADTNQRASIFQQSNVTVNMNYSTAENLYQLTLESQASIDYVLVHCDSDVQISDVERNLAILSFMTSNAEQTIATFRCQANTTRLDVKIRGKENSKCRRVGLYISPNINPRCAIKKTFDLPCLCHHLRCHSFHWNDRPGSQLTFRGSFSLADAHNWVYSCLPNVPDKVPPDNDITFYFTHSQWKTMLSCRYRKGEAVFQSDNIATLSLIREFISERATSKNMQLQITTEVFPAATDQLLQRTHPLLLEEIRRARQIKLGSALKEIVADQIALNSNDDWMNAEFSQILTVANESDETLTTNRIDEMLDFLVELYISHKALEGQANHLQPEMLKGRFSDCTTDQLLEMFMIGKNVKNDADDYRLTFAF